MKGLLSLFCGLFATFAFSWVGLALIPNIQIGHLDPQMEEDGTDVYPAPQSGMAERGRRIYTANGCVYCHSLQMRPDYSASDVDRTRDLDKNQKWGTRRSAPRDYLFDRPVLLGKERTGPDLANIGKASVGEDQGAGTPGASPAAAPGASPANPATTASAAPAPSPPAASSPAVATASPTLSQANPPSSLPPAAPGPGKNAQPSSPTAASTLDTNAKPGEPKPYSAAWHHQHLYSPRTISPESNMPAFRFLYEKRRISGEPSLDALKITGSDVPLEGWEIIPTYDAKCLVAFLMSRDQSHPLKEVKSTGPATSSAPSPAPKQGAAK